MLKRAFLAMVCLTALLFSLVPGAAGVDYRGIYCVAVNDNIIWDFLTPAAMPFLSGGQFYVHHSVFDSNKTGQPVHINVNYKREDDTYTMFVRQKTLVFHISGGYSSDGEGNRYTNHRAISRDGEIFLPARFVSEFFGLDFVILGTEISTGVVTILRISDDQRALPDEQFASGASYTVAGPVTAYYRAMNQTPSPSPSPSVPSPSPSVSPPPQPSGEVPDRREVSVRFAFEVRGDIGGIGEVLSALAAARQTALFLFPAGQMAGLDDTVRRVLGQGHGVGLLLEDGEEFAEGNRLLAHIARTETRMVALSGSMSAEEGWVVWHMSIDGRSAAQTAAMAQANAILSRAASARGTISLTMDCTPRSGAALSRVLQELQADNYTLRPVGENG